MLYALDGVNSVCYNTYIKAEFKFKTLKMLINSNLEIAKVTQDYTM